MAVKWDRTTSPGLPVSNHGLTAECGTNAFQSGIRATLPRWRGLRYFEVRLVAGVTHAVGISGAISQTSFPGLYPVSFGWGGNGIDPQGQKLSNTGSGYTTSSYGTPPLFNHTVGVLVDFTARTIEFFLDGVSQGVAFTSIPPGAYFPAVGSGSNSGQIVTANFGATPFAFPPGVGELPWDDVPDPVVWDSLRFGANGALTNNNHTFAIGPNTNQDNAKATFGRDSARGGKFYFEITTNPGSNAPIIGLANTAHLASQCLGFFSGSWVGIFMFSPSAYYHDGTPQGGTLWLNGAWVIGVMVDFDTGQLIFRYHVVGAGGGTTLPTAGFTNFKRIGTLYPTAGDGGIGGPVDHQYTINCGDSAFTIPLPAGYQSWDGTQENTGCDWYYGDRGSVSSVLGATGVVTFNDATAVRGVKPHWKGRFYFETTLMSAGNVMIGVGNRLAPLTYPGADFNGAGYFSNTGNKFYGNVQTAYGASYTFGDVISVLLDIDNHTVEFWKNGVSQGVAFTFAATDFYEFLPMIGQTSVAALQVATNFGQDAFVYVPPVGYVAWNANDLWMRPVPLDMVSATSHPPFIASSAAESNEYGFDYKVFDDAYLDGDNSDIVGLQFPLSGGLGGTWTAIDFDQDEDATYQIKRIVFLLGEGGFGGLASGYAFRFEGYDGAAWQVVRSVDIASGNPIHQNLVYDVSDATQYHKLRAVMLRGDPAPGPVQQAKIGRFVPLALVPVLTPEQTVDLTGIASVETFGAPTLIPGVVFIRPAGIASAEAFGQGEAPVQLTGMDHLIALRAISAIVSAEAFGTPAIRLRSVEPHRAAGLGVGLIRSRFKDFSTRR